MRIGALDGVLHDDELVERAKAVLGAAGLIDHHADRGGFTPSPATNYLELFPFIDSLWYGEGFDYDAAQASSQFTFGMAPQPGRPRRPRRPGRPLLAPPWRRRARPTAERTPRAP